MIVMPANNSSRDVWYWQGRYGGLGWLLSAYWKRGTSDKRRIDPRMPWAVDNGLFAVETGENLFWDADTFYRGLANLLEDADAIGHPPRWVAVPDKWGDRDETLRRWDLHAPRLMQHDVPLAMVVQDGMMPRDVPPEAEVVFVGGSDPWREHAIPMWCACAERVHVGRVNTLDALRFAAASGAESADGTGFFRGSRDRPDVQRRIADLERFIRDQHRTRVTPLPVAA